LFFCNVHLQNGEDSHVDRRFGELTEATKTIIDGGYDGYGAPTKKAENKWVTGFITLLLVGFLTPFTTGRWLVTHI